MAKAMTALNFATERLQIAQVRFKELQNEELSPTTPGTAKKCILPVQPRKDYTKNIFRQLHKNNKGQLYYVTKSHPAHKGGVIVEPDDPRIYFNCAIRQQGLHVYDGEDAKVHHRDV